MKQLTITLRFVLTFVAGILFAQDAWCQGNLLITPRRIVFEGNKKVAEVNVANIGKDTARYVISFVEMRMKEDGSFETVTNPDSNEHLASKYLRFFPRTVVLGPNEPQVVKVQLYNTGSLAPGEYRSHMYFRAVPETKALGDTILPPSEPGAISVKLTPIFGITIPVIIRKGEVNSSVSFSDVSLTMENDTLPKVNLVFNREGNCSVYGDVEIQHVSKNGKRTRVFIAKGLSVYTPNKLRKVKAMLDTHAGVDFHSGSLEVTYTAQNDTKDKLATASIDLQ